MTQQLMPFGAGTRVCGGQNLAQIILKVLVSSVVRNFNISANPSETNERTMEIRDAFVSTSSDLNQLRDVLTCCLNQVIFPAGMHCKLSFHPRA